MTGEKLVVLVLYRQASFEPMRAASRTHLRVLERTGHKVIYANAFSPIPVWIRRISCDAIVLHTTFLTMRWHPQFALYKWDNRWIADHPAEKVALPQDEYDRSEVLDEWLAALGVSAVFTNFGEEYRSTLYPIMSGRARFEKCFTGYVDESLVESGTGRFRPLALRDLDLAYRAARLPYSFGSHGVVKYRVAEAVAAAAARRGLRTDIATGSDVAIAGDAWHDFVGSARSVIGVESGSSVLDRRGEIRSLADRTARDEPDLGFDEFSERLPEGWDSYRFFAIGPRHFEAAATKTAQLLVEGEYEGVLVPDRHYVPIKHDFSNLEDVFDRLKDRETVQRMVDCAYEEIALNPRYGYGHLAAQLDEALAELALRKAPSFDRGWVFVPPQLARTMSAVAVAVGLCGRVVGTTAHALAPGILGKRGRARRKAWLKRVRRGRKTIRKRVRSVLVGLVERGRRRGRSG